MPSMMQKCRKSSSAVFVHITENTTKLQPIPAKTTEFCYFKLYHYTLSKTDVSFVVSHWVKEQIWLSEVSHHNTTVAKIPLIYNIDTQCCWENREGEKETQRFFSALQLNINHILLRQAEIRKYHASTHKATDAHVSRCAELLSKASHLLLWLLHWIYSSKQEKKMQEPISLSTPDIGSQYN